jgi:hypothetical protein
MKIKRAWRNGDDNIKLVSEHNYEEVESKKSGLIVRKDSGNSQSSINTIAELTRREEVVCSCSIIDCGSAPAKNCETRRAPPRVPQMSCY